MTFLNVVEIESALAALNSTYPTLTRFMPLPNLTVNGRRSNALLIRGNGYFDCRPAFVFVSGVHAREWGGPDILVNLATDLLEAYTTNAGLAYGGNSFSGAAVKAIVNRTDIVVFPDINPDGRAYSMAALPNSTQAMWRKNRNGPGIDVNRNYDFLWDFPVKFAPNVSPASTNPASDTYHGTGPFSEPESRNVQWLVDQFPNARFFVDVHSFTGLVLYPWGDDENQTTDPSKSFKNSAWDGQRGLTGGTYSDYHPAGRLAEHQAAANVMRDGIFAVRGQSYVAKQGFLLYPTSGTSEDWAFTREFLDPNRGQLSGFCIEFNKNVDFFPTWAEMLNLIADIDAGLIALADYACPSFWWVFVCWLRHRWWGIWHRVFPPELWGPYGPWTKITRVVEHVVDRIATAIQGIAAGGGR